MSLLSPGNPKYPLSTVCDSFKEMATQAKMNIGSCFLWKHFFGHFLHGHSQQLCGWPDDLPVDHISEVTFLQITTEDWLNLFKACSRTDADQLRIWDADGDALMVSVSGCVLLSQKRVPANLSAGGASVLGKCNDRLPSVGMRVLTWAQPKGWPLRHRVRD